MRSKLYRAAACRPLPLRSYMFRGLLPRFHGPRRSELTLYEQLTDLSWQFRVADLSSPIAVRHPTVLEAMALMGLPEDHAFLASAYAHSFCSAPRTVDACCVQSYCHQCLRVMEALGRAWNFIAAALQLRWAHRHHLRRLTDQRTPTSLDPEGTTQRDLGCARDLVPQRPSAWS